MEKIHFQQFEDFVNDVISTNNIPGAAIAISKDGQIIYKQGFGLPEY
jgi:hypothetical protein